MHTSSLRPSPPLALDLLSEAEAAAAAAAGENSLSCAVI